MTTEADSQRARPHLVRHIEDSDPGIDQGRNRHHNPRRDRDISVMLFAIIAGPTMVILAIFGFVQFVKWLAQ